MVPLNQLPASEWGVSSTPQALRPFPQYLNVTHLTNDGNSFYNALQTSLQRRWQSGVLSFAYTWAKITDDVDGPAGSSPIQNVYNLRAEHGIASYDVPHRFVASYVYRIPLGRGSKLLNGVPVVQDVVRGWEFSGITEFQIGLPLSVSQSNGTGGFTGTQRPNQIAAAALPRRSAHAGAVVQHQRLYGGGGLHVGHRAALLVLRAGHQQLGHCR